MIRVARSEIIGCLRRAGFEFEDQTKRTQIWRRAGQHTRVFIPHRDYYDERDVMAILGPAGFSPDQVQQFLRTCLKS